MDNVEKVDVSSPRQKLLQSIPGPSHLTTNKLFTISTTFPPPLFVKIAPKPAVPVDKTLLSSFKNTAHAMDTSVSMNTITTMDTKYTNSSIPSYSRRMGLFLKGQKNDSKTSKPTTTDAMAKETALFWDTDEKELCATKAFITIVFSPDIYQQITNKMTAKKRIFEEVSKRLSDMGFSLPNGEPIGSEKCYQKYRNLLSYYKRSLNKKDGAKKVKYFDLLHLHLAKKYVTPKITMNSFSSYPIPSPTDSNNSESFSDSNPDKSTLQPPNEHSYHAPSPVQSIPGPSNLPPNTKFTISVPSGPSHLVKIAPKSANPADKNVKEQKKPKPTFKRELLNVLKEEARIRKEELEVYKKVSQKESEDRAEFLSLFKKLVESTSRKRKHEQQ